MYDKEVLSMVKSNPASGQFNGIYEELALLVGIDTVIKIYDAFKGQQITLPKRLFSQEFVTEQILKCCTDTQTIKAMALKYGYTERWIRSILKKHIDSAV